MSRKDPRAVLLVVLDADEREWLRKHAHGRSMADALRKVVAGADLTIAARGGAGRPLALQLPKADRSRLAQAAVGAGQTPADLVRGALRRAMADT